MEVIVIAVAKKPVIVVAMRPKTTLATMVIAVENMTVTCAAIAAKDTFVGVGQVFVCKTSTVRVDLITTPTKMPPVSGGIFDKLFIIIQVKNGRKNHKNDAVYNAN